MSIKSDGQQQPTTPALVEFEPMSRSAFLLKGALATSALYGAAAVGPMVRAAFGQQIQDGDPSDDVGSGPKGSKDVDILNFALTIEFLEAEYYERALDAVDLGGELRSLAQEFASNEQTHVKQLTQTIKDMGGKPTSKPSFSFPLGDVGGFVKQSIAFEDTGVQAYNGAGPMLSSKELLAAAGSIVQVEARHAAAIRVMDGQQAQIDAFDIAMSMDEVLNEVQPFIQS
ncbi:MAG: ferritin-like domain-containing protein [Solirubrobacterales bacterium]